MSTIISSVGEDIGTLLKSFERYLRATNKAPKTIKSWTDTLRRFRDFLTDNGMPTDIRRLTREHVETHIAVQIERFRPKTAQIRYGDLQQFFKWATEEREIKVSPDGKHEAAPGARRASSGTYSGSTQSST